MTQQRHEARVAQAPLCRCSEIRSKRFLRPSSLFVCEGHVFPKNGSRDPRIRTDARAEATHHARNHLQERVSTKQGAGR